MHIFFLLPRCRAVPVVKTLFMNVYDTLLFLINIQQTVVIVIFFFSAIFFKELSNVCLSFPGVVPLCKRN